jgi:membrane peptidoglycan carboxypeptidase
MLDFIKRINFKRIIGRLVKVLLILAAIISVILLVYTGIVYIEFVGNRDSIFAKIEGFSNALGKVEETDIMLGQEEENEKSSTVFLDRNKRIIARYSPVKHKLISLREIPFYVSQGFVMIEDQAFYNHMGINPVRLALAVVRNVVTFGNAPGGSTISQQLSKILFTKAERNIKRKVYELFCTLEMESRFSKNEILQIYLNSIYLGHGIYGIENAARFYFDKNASELTIAESALFVGMNRAPEYYSPIKYRENAERIQRHVLLQFVHYGFLEKSEMELEYQRFWERFDQMSGAAGNQSIWKTEVNNSGYITEYVRQILAREFSYEKITQGGLIVETTIDLEKQRLAERIIQSRLKSIRRNIGETALRYKYDDYTPKKLDQVEASFASVNYDDGEILVLVGGSQYSFANQFNRAVNAFRPIGSSVKPFIYAMALQQKTINETDFQPFTRYKDEAYTYTINGQKYAPVNYHGDPSGEYVTIYDALKTSLNTIAVNVFDQMEPRPVADFIRDAAFLYTTQERKRVPEVLSLSLGTCELSPLEVAVAYTVFPRGGKSLYPVLIRKISDRRGYVYYDVAREKNPRFNTLVPEEHREAKQLINPEVAYEVVQMMKGVFEKGGTGTWPARVTGLSIPAYAKSGTTQDYRDGWFTGFTDKEVSAAWVGLDSNDSILLPGASTAGMIWCDYNNQVASRVSSSIPRPRNMTAIRVCNDTGMKATRTCPDVRLFYFWNDGPKPTGCTMHMENIDEWEVDQ